MQQIKKEEALKQIDQLKSEISKLEKIIQTPENLFDRLKTFQHVLTEYDNMRREDNRLKQYNYPLSKYDRIEILGIVLNQGWKPNWNNDNERKYYPYFIQNKTNGWSVDVGCDSSDSVCSVVLYKDEDAARFAGTKFIDLYIPILNQEQ